MSEVGSGVSVLLPARGRPASIFKSVESVFAHAAAPHEVEVLVRLDDDDPELAEIKKVLTYAGIPEYVHVEVGPRLGYDRMQDYYGGLAARARGRRFVSWNDDMTMLTPGWDVLVDEAPLFSIQWLRRDVTSATDFTLPVIGRPVWEAMGRRLSNNAYCDAWLADVSTFAHVAVVRNDVAFHHDRLDDQTMRDQGLHREREWARFQTQKQERLEDLRKIVAHPDYESRFDGWEVDVQHPTLDYLTLCEGEYPPSAWAIRGRK